MKQTVIITVIALLFWSNAMAESITSVSHTGTIGKDTSYSFRVEESKAQSVEKPQNGYMTVNPKFVVSNLEITLNKKHSAVPKTALIDLSNPQLERTSFSTLAMTLKLNSNLEKDFPHLFPLLEAKEGYTVRLLGSDGAGTWRAYFIIKEGRLTNRIVEAGDRKDSPISTIYK